MNREVVGPFKHRKKRSTDVTVTGDLVQGVWRVAEEAGWLTELEELCGSSWKKKGEGKEERREEDVKDELAGKFVLASHSSLLTPTFIPCKYLYLSFMTTAVVICNTPVSVGICSTLSKAF